MKRPLGDRAETDRGGAGTKERRLRDRQTRAVPSARRDFLLLWASQSVTVLGDQFLVLALPLLAVSVLGVSPGEAALLPFALFVPYLAIGLPAGAIVDRLPRRSAMLACDAIQAGVFGLVAGLAALGALTFPLLAILVAVAGSAAVFYQVAYSSYLPQLLSDPADIHRGNARLFLSESLARTVGPIVAGPAIAVLGIVSAIALNAATFAASALGTMAIRHREDRSPPPPRGGGWVVADVRAGIAFVLGHDQLEPVIACGAVYVAFMSALQASLVLYLVDVLRLDPAATGLVLGAAAAGFPVGNLLSGRLVASIGVARTLAVSAVVSVGGLILMPLGGSASSVVALVAGSVIHGIGEGAFGPTSLTLRQTVTPSSLLGRVNAIQRFVIWGMIPIGSLAAFGIITVAGLQAAVWIGALGTALCLPVLVRRGIARDLRRRTAT